MIGGAADQEDLQAHGRGRLRLDVPDSPLLERVQEWVLEHSVEHVHGPKQVDYETDELVVLVLLRNGKPYVKAFVEHYFSMGAKHIVFLDNGSTDGTVEALQAYDHVTVLRSGLPYQRYNVAMKRYLIERFGRGRWTLSVDIDELFDYPYSDVVGLKALLGYLNDNSFTAVVSYMLDMFPEEPLSGEDPLGSKGSLKELHRFYDLSEIQLHSYHDVGDIGNVLANEETKVLTGGVQRRLFGIHPLLTKHPLVFLDDRLKPMDLSDHWAGNARVADFTGVLLHYKLSANLYGLVQLEMKERRYINRHGKYDRYRKVLENAPTLLIKNETSRELKSVNDLVGSRIMSVSRRYVEFVEKEERRKGHYSEEGRSERLLEAFFNARTELAAYSETTRNLQVQLRKLRGEANRERRQKDILEEQIRAIQSSRSWRVLGVLGRAKAVAKGLFGRLGARGKR